MSLDLAGAGASARVGSRGVGAVAGASLSGIRAGI